MIGKISIGKTFAGCINYCLEDKIDKTTGEVVFEHRAAILFGNYCYGTKDELVAQFNDVRALNPRIEKPVMHITLSLAPGEQVEREKLIEMVYSVAKEMNFDRNEYLAVSHTDTNHQHVHIVVNRVGYDGKTLKDNHNYGKIAACCRKMEIEYGLKQVLSPRKYLSAKDRLIPRQDARKETLKQHIKQTLASTKNYEEFKARINAGGYQVLKGRGISFIDDKGVKVKGSEVGYSLSRIEQLLRHKQEQIVPRPSRPMLPGDFRKIQKEETRTRASEGLEAPKESGLAQAAELLLKPEEVREGLNPKLLEGQKRKKRKRKSLGW